MLKLTNRKLITDSKIFKSPDKKIVNILEKSSKILVEIDAMDKKFNSTLFVFVLKNLPKLIDIEVTVVNLSNLKELYYYALDKQIAKSTYINLNPFKENHQRKLNSYISAVLHSANKRKGLLTKDEQFIYELYIEPVLKNAKIDSEISEKLLLDHIVEDIYTFSDLDKVIRVIKKLFSIQTFSKIINKISKFQEEFATDYESKRKKLISVYEMKETEELVKNLVKINRVLYKHTRRKMDLSEISSLISKRW